MSRIEDFIARFCPKGVEYRTLGEVVSGATGIQLNRSAMADDGPYAVFNGGTRPSGRHTAFNAGPNVVTVSEGGASAGYVNFVREPFWAGGHCYVLHPAADLESRFLYYALKTKEGKLQAAKLGAGIPHLGRTALFSISVPIPPVEVQREIVRALDTFTELEVALEAELEARRQQYEHYRGSILDFTNSNRARPIPLGELVDFINGKPHERLVDPDGEIALMTAKFISTQGRSVRFVRSSDVLTPARKNEIAMVMSDLPNGRALARAFYVGADDRYAANQRVCLLRARDPQVIDPRFLFYVVDRNKQLLRYDSGFDQTHLKKGDILAIQIPVPPIREQHRVVAALDSFDTLVNDRSVGLLAELNARRQQYDHYRERLLTFPEAA